VPSLEPKEKVAMDAASTAWVAKPGALAMPAILLLMGQAVPQSETGAGELEHMGVEGQTIEERGRQSLIASKELRPLGERDRGRDDEADVFVQCRQATKEEIRSCFGEGNESHLIEEEEIEPQQTPLEAGEPMRCLCFEEVIG